MTPPPPEGNTPLSDGSDGSDGSVGAAGGDNSESGFTPLPPSRLTFATRFAVRGLAEGAVAGIVTGVLTGFISLVLPVGLAVVAGEQTPDMLAGWLYVTALYGVIFGALVGMLAAAVLLTGVGAVVAVWPRTLHWRGWPRLAGSLVAVAVVIVFIPAESYSTSFLSGDVVVGVTVATVAGVATVWRTRALLRSRQARAVVASSRTSLGGATA